MSDQDTIEMEECCMCQGMFMPGSLDFLGRCEPCFRLYLEDPKPLLLRPPEKTGNPHNPKETKGYVDRLERKRMTPQGIDHNYVKRIYG